MMRIPNYGSQINGSQTNGSAAGRAYTLPNTLAPAGSVLSCVAVVYTATATAGSRILGLIVKDPASNVLTVAICSTAITAGQTVNVAFGAGMPQSGAVGLITAPIPVEFPIPPGAIVSIFDTANIDPNDTQAVKNIYKF